MFSYTAAAVELIIRVISIGRREFVVRWALAVIGARVRVEYLVSDRRKLADV